MFNADAVLGEPSQAHLDRVGYGLGIPWPRNPVRIEPDHEDAGYPSRCVHYGTLRRGGRLVRSDGIERRIIRAVVSAGLA